MRRPRRLGIGPRLLFVLAGRAFERRARSRRVYALVPNHLPLTLPPSFPILCLSLFAISANAVAYFSLLSSIFIAIDHRSSGDAFPDGEFRYFVDAQLLDKSQLFVSRSLGYLSARACRVTFLFLFLPVYQTGSSTGF